MRVIDLAGRTFGSLLVLCREGTKNTFAAWRVRCGALRGDGTACGVEKVVSGHELRRGTTQSCGCHREPARLAKVVTHGRTRSREWNSWMAMRHRCNTTTDPSYARYGGRGIRVCDRWNASFEAFMADMGPRPPEHTLDRVDNERGYDCGRCDDCIARGAVPNCRWAGRVVQASNQRRNRLLTLDGRTQTIAAWAREKGLLKTTIRQRLDLGWPVEEALTAAPDLASRWKRARR